MRLPLPFLTLCLAACVAPQAPTPTASRRPLSASAAPSGTQRGPLIGQTATQLARLLGTPRQEARELDARRLQWGDERCVLDAYLYPRGRGERVATYLDARDPSGEPVDADACATLLRAR